MNFAFHILRHPIDGFWEMKFLKKGSNTVAVVILIADLLTAILCRQIRGFIFNDAYNVPLDILYQIRIIIFPVLLFTVANWAITTLMDGKGTFSEIFQVTCYSLVPLILFRLDTSVISNLFTLNEAPYLTINEGEAVLWM